MKRVKQGLAARRRARRSGYTLVEVLMAISILIFGILSILALHRLTLRGNMHAREMTTATQLASTWIERLQMDSAAFSYQPATQTFAFTGARWLSLTTVTAPGNAPNWITPARTIDGQGATFDYFGRDTADAGQMYYCTNIRLQWVLFRQAMRADVRVWWLRHGGEAVETGLGACGAGTAPNAITLRAPRDIHAVYASTIIRWTR